MMWEGGRGPLEGEAARGRGGLRTYNSAVADAEGGAFELGTDGPKVILVGIDDSVTSLRAGAYAAGLARRQGARLVCVYVERPSAMYGAAAGAGASAIAAQEQARWRDGVPNCSTRPRRTRRTVPRSSSRPT